MQVAGQKKKFRTEDFQSLQRAQLHEKQFNSDKQQLDCMCEVKSLSKVMQCFRCQASIHECLADKVNRGEKFECLSCLNKSLDPLFKVNRVLVESCFKTKSIFDSVQIFNFEFNFHRNDTKEFVEVRGLIPKDTALKWPMQGQFYLNDDPEPFHQLKPLLSNSNRKARREEYFLVPQNRLKYGVNTIKFKIPCLDRGRFKERYQFEEKKVYYMSVNVVVKMEMGELENFIFERSRVEEKESIRLLRQSVQGIEITQNKLNLVCPYTTERIRVPVRGRYCSHFSCFCLRTLVITHAEKRNWNCPLCDAKVNEPCVDMWIFKMLRDNELGSEVIAYPNGKYEWVKQQVEVEIDLESSSPMRIQEPEEEVKEEKNVIQVQDPVEVIDIEDEPLVVAQSPEPDHRRIQAELQARIVSKVRGRIEESMHQRGLDTTRIIPEEQLGLQPRVDSRTSRSKMLEEKPAVKKREAVIKDVKTLQVREMKFDELHKQYFKDKLNPFKKFVTNEELKKLFRDVV